MNLQFNFIINFYSMIILIIIYAQSVRNTDKTHLGNKLFQYLIRITFIMLALDIFSRFDGNPGGINSIINGFGNYMVFLLAPVIPSIWFAYVHYQVFQNEIKTRKLIYPLAIINGLNFIILTLSQSYGWYYNIDSANIYHRGPLYWVAPAITFLFILFTTFLIILNRNKLEKKYFLPLMLFTVPPVICSLLQIVFYGLSFILSGMILSILIALLNIQNKDIYTDHLTGVYNRKKLEMYLKDKINTSSAGRSFSAIMIDLDDFKMINDNYGHDEGDRALKIFADLLNSCIRSNDFIGRFGGDEFYIVLNVYELDRLKEVISRIRDCVEEYNLNSEKPYEFKFSLGHAVYDYESRMTVEEFESHLDSKMYKNKRIAKQNNYKTLIKL